MKARRRPRAREDLKVTLRGSLRARDSDLAFRVIDHHFPGKARKSFGRFAPPCEARINNALRRQLATEERLPRGPKGDMLICNL